jgi:hypothetical protein
MLMAFGISLIVIGFLLMVADIADTLRRIEKKMNKKNV